MSSNFPARTFTDRPATRERVPLLLGIVGPSGSGKTFSALRLAAGIRRVVGGDVYMIDTEARRGLHYADLFDFRHVEFTAPFSPLDYLAAIQHCVDRGAKTIIVDSASHEHEGPGGVLEEHQKEAERLSSLWRTSIDKAQIPAWSEPKRKRRLLINTFLQMPVNFIFCFRAKEKVKLLTKKEREAAGERETVKALGFMPIAGDEFVYEMTLNCLLLPGSAGVPSWHPEEMGERAIVKLPEQFKGFFAEVAPLSEDTGARLAEWAASAPKLAAPPESAVVAIASVVDRQAKRNGKPTAFSLVTTSDGRELGTFDVDLAARARTAADLEAPVLISWKRTEKGGCELLSVAHAPDAEAPPPAEIPSDTTQPEVPAGY